MAERRERERGGEREWRERGGIRRVTVEKEEEECERTRPGIGRGYVRAGVMSAVNKSWNGNVNEGLVKFLLIFLFNIFSAS